MAKKKKQIRPLRDGLQFGCRAMYGSLQLFIQLAAAEGRLVLEIDAPGKGQILFSEEDISMSDAKEKLASFAGSYLREEHSPNWKCS